MVVLDGRRSPIEPHGNQYFWRSFIFPTKSAPFSNKEGWGRGRGGMEREAKVIAKTVIFSKSFCEIIYSFFYFKNSSKSKVSYLPRYEKFFHFEN